MTKPPSTPWRVELFYRASCLGKRSYNKVKAHIVAADMSAREKESLHAYQCVFCGNWHVGHRNERREPRDQDMQ